MGPSSPHAAPGLDSDMERPACPPVAEMLLSPPELVCAGARLRYTKSQKTSPALQLRWLETKLSWSRTAVHKIKITTRRPACIALSAQHSQPSRKIE